MEVENNALMARRFAYLNDIPIVEDPPLARALLAKAKLDQYIPEEFIDPVVVVLKWVREVNKQKSGSESGEH
jgi:flagellar biosynthesis protein FlhB